ncbi:MAG TPA: phospholipase D-like domain-containing protein [Kofleriaceae bacterium]|nr:phospholipase D-like domain-containing protein [Kofleriaceae bacterium]
MLVTTACTEPTAGPSDDGLDAVAAKLSPIGQDVIAALRTGHAESRGQTWDVGTDNSFDADWVVQTPLASYWGTPASSLPVVSTCSGDPQCDPDFDLIACSAQSDCRFGGTCTTVAATVTHPGAAARQLCAGHSDAIYDRIYGLLVQANSSIEISSLAPPDGRFEAAVRNALTYLASTGGSVRVRYMYGAILGAALIEDPRTPDQVLASLVRDVESGTGLRVAVGELRDGIESWDHAKIIAVDGTKAIVGGHNMWTRHYLEAAPVHDLSMQVTGSAAFHASQFADVLWRHACKPPADLASVALTSGFPDATVGCDPSPLVAPAVGTGTGRVLTVGRLGALGDNAADDAIVALVDASQSTLRLSIQDVGPVGAGMPWPEPYLRALAAATGRGVDVQIVMTNLNARPDGLSAGSSSYSNGWTPADVAQQVAAYATAHAEVMSGADASAALCTHLHVATLRQGTDDLWPNGATFANHAKLAIVDDAAFYLGSQNWYPANLFELGYIVDDPATTRQLLDAYYTPAWTESSRDVVSACP